MKRFFYAGILFILVLFMQCDRTETGADRDSEGFTFVFLTDVHLQPELNAPEGFRKAIGRINELNPDFVITGGDLVMDALGVSYGRADSLYNLYLDNMNRFDMPVYNGIGNHEVYGLYEQSGCDTTHQEFGKKMFENRIGKRYQSFDHKGWHFIMLDAIGISPARKYYGYIDGEQIEWIKSDLAGLDKTTPIAISVHIPFITSHTQLTRGPLEANDQGSVISNGTDVLKLFLPYNLRLVLQGHLHFLEDLYVDNQVHFITGGAVSGRWWQGPPSRQTEEGFLLVRANGDLVDWDYVDYGWEAVKK